MFLAEIKVENFRIFGEDDEGLRLKLGPGLTAIVGENDSGKTALVDALRLALGTRDQEGFRVDDADFHQSSSRVKQPTIRIKLKFDGLTVEDTGTFAEYVTYEERDAKRVPVFYLNWTCSEAPKNDRRAFQSTEVRSGPKGDGPPIDVGVRGLLSATYLRPLRDAEKAMSSGRRSRLSQILQHTAEVATHGSEFDLGNPVDPKALSVVGIGDLADNLLSSHEGVKNAQARLNDKYLGKLSFSGSPLRGQISVSGSRNTIEVRLRQLLEKLELELRDGNENAFPANKGLGSNNLLFMACELLLLGAEDSAVPLLIVEEPEAHLHPQRQLKLVQFLMERAVRPPDGDRQVQILITTHSPTLGSLIDLDNIVVMQKGRSFSLANGLTMLDRSDYAFLNRFLDATRANMFFARGVMIVEGDAENIILPTVARLIDRDLASHGTSIVNVGGVGLRRYARVFQRQSETEHRRLDVPVACVTDMDVMPECAPEILRLKKSEDPMPPVKSRRWRVESDFPGKKLDDRRSAIRARADGQTVQTFVADHWTLEYDLAFAGLGEEVWIAAHLAEADEIAAETKSPQTIEAEALASYKSDVLTARGPEEQATRVYAFIKDGLSKAAVAQYLASVLADRVEKKVLTSAALRSKLPKYLVQAIEYSTSAAAGEGVSASAAAVKDASSGVTP